MRVLIGCEESQAVCIAFRNRGFEAFYCDIQPCSGGFPEWHLQMDIFQALDYMKWDMLIAHPPCTYLTRRAQYWNIKRKRHTEKEEAIEFFMQLADFNIAHKALENPIGIINTIYKKPTQIIQPYQFGDTEQKATCLWLYGLPKLKPTNIVAPQIDITKNGHRISYVDRIPLNKDRQRLRSKTFPGIAEAMAKQWGDFILSGQKIGEHKQLDIFQ